MAVETRAAVVRGVEPTVSAQATIERYLPSNYSLYVTEVDGALALVIAGEDRQGWTLDGYVIPRLASGLYFAQEVHGTSLSVR